MPFLEPDDWEKHLYKKVECPDDIIIPVSDSAGWRYFPKYNRFYNKVELCKEQGLECSLHGDWPDFWPVFSKPTSNVWGMGIGIKVLHSFEEAEESFQPGHFWCEILKGDHNSFDVVLVDGEPIWWTQYTALIGQHGSFDYWFLREPDEVLIAKFFDFVRKHFKNYTGIINLESIGDTLIEIHIRVSSQFLFVYGDEFLKSVVKLYKDGIWTWNEDPRGYSIGVYIEKEYDPKIDWDLVDELRDDEVDLQMCLESEVYNPPRHYRLALIQTKDLEKGVNIRKELVKMVKKRK